MKVFDLNASLWPHYRINCFIGLAIRHCSRKAHHAITSERNDFLFDSICINYSRSSRLAYKMLASVCVKVSTEVSPWMSHVTHRDWFSLWVTSGETQIFMNNKFCLFYRFQFDYSSSVFDLRSLALCRCDAIAQNVALIHIFKSLSLWWHNLK